jgi:signal transduction histidine kinase
MVSYARLERFWERLSGDAGRGVSLLQSTRKRLLTFTALLTFAVALLWVALTGPAMLEQRPLLALACATVPFLFLPFPYLALRTSLDLDILALGYLTTLYMAVALTAATLGGAVSTTSFFLFLVPLLATLLMGIRAGLFWVTIVALTYAGLDIFRGLLPGPAFELTGNWPNDQVGVSEVSRWNAIMLTLLALAASLSVANFRAVVSRSSALLADAAGKTQDAVHARAVAETVNRLRAEFIANVSHELRTPLNAIIGYSELLIETAGERGDEAGAADNRRVLEAAAKLRSMVNDIMKLSAIDAGRVGVEIEEVNVEALARDAVAALAPAAARTGNRIDLSCEGDLTQCRTDGVKLDSCLRTLLSHAIGSTRDGTVSVRASATQESGRAVLCLEVEDSGEGVDQAAIEYLFEPFAQTGDAKLARLDGPALGLALCRRLARLMGGDLAAKPSSAGGVHFTLKVGLDADAERAAA